MQSIFLKNLSKTNIFSLLDNLFIFFQCRTTFSHYRDFIGNNITVRQVYTTFNYLVFQTQLLFLNIIYGTFSVLKEKLKYSLILQKKLQVLHGISISKYLLRELYCFLRKRKLFRKMLRKNLCFLMIFLLRNIRVI